MSNAGTFSGPILDGPDGVKNCCFFISLIKSFKILTRVAALAIGSVSASVFKYILPLPPNNSSNDCKPSKHKQYINSSKYTHNLATLNANCVTTSNIFKCMMTNTMGWILGFRQDKYENLLINNISGSLLLSESLFDGGGDRYIYLSIDDYQNSKNILNIGCLDNFIIEKNIIAKIPMVNGKLSLVINDNEAPLTKIRKYNGPVNIKTLNIKLIDKFGDIIDLNCLDYSFTLELEILYEGFNFSNINK